MPWKFKKIELGNWKLEIVSCILHLVSYRSRMNKLATVAIIGRPNTGKSTLFNRLVGRNKAITSNVPGTTRDQIAHTVEAEGYQFLLIDTGGMGGGTEDKDLEDDVHEQSVLALEHADIIIATLDSRTELTRNDYEIIDTLRKRKRQHVPVLFALTKCDDPHSIEQLLPQYYELAEPEHIVAVSAPHKIGIEALQQKIVTELKQLHFEPKQPEEVNHTPRIAIIGRPNVGKSSIINALMSDKKRDAAGLLVSDTAGTTRDSTDTTIRYEGKDYTFVDTAGIKRKKDTPEGIETHAYFRSIRSLEHSDIAVLVLDAKEPVSRQDKRIANLAISEGKGLIVLINKWDTVKTPEEKKKVQEHIRYSLAFCDYANFTPVSAHTKEGLLKIFASIEQVHQNRTRRISTKHLLQFLQDATYDQPVGQLTSCKHIVQADEVPPTFILFVRDPKQVQLAHLRFLENRMREVFDFTGTPIRFITKGKSSKVQKS